MLQVSYIHLFQLSITHCLSIPAKWFDSASFGSLSLSSPHRNTGSATGTAGARRWYSSRRRVGPSRRSRRTTATGRPGRSFQVEFRFGRSGSSSALFRWLIPSGSGHRSSRSNSCCHWKLLSRFSDGRLS